MADRFCRYQLSKRAKIHVVLGEDRISQLPNSILVCIVSKLKLDEAARTSVLSHTWRDLWKRSTRLDFDGSVLLRNREIMILSKGRQRLKYLNWVNKVLKSVKSNKELALDEFRLCFELFSSTEKAIYNWLSYAFERRVQKLELDFMIPDNYTGSYRFPRLLDQNTKELSEDPDCRNRRFTYTLEIADFNSLRSLSLTNVYVIREALEYILRKFPRLEHLKVCDSITGSINISGSSLALKHLEITRSPGLKSIIVRDTSIVSLKVTGEPDLVLENNPKLVDVYVCVPRSSVLRPHLFSYLSGVEVLTLCFLHYRHKEDAANPIEIPRQLIKVKQLIFVVEEVIDDDFINLLSLLGSFPNLEKLIFKLNSICSAFNNYDRNYGKPSSLPLPHLRVFEFHGYSGRSGEDAVVMHVVENAASLQRITVNSELNGLQFPHNLFGRCCNWQFPKHPLGACHYLKYPHDPFDRCTGKAAAVKRIRDNAKVRAHHLKGVIPSSIEVVIL